MKKVATVLLIFVALFLFWPSTKFGDSCTESIPQDSLDARFGLGISKDCAPPQVYDRIGGGLKYLYRNISDEAAGVNTDIGGSSHLYDFKDGSYFNPKHALTSSLIITSIFSLLAYISAKIIKRKK